MAKSTPTIRKNHQHPRDNLLSWFDRHKRDLPWRRSEDPYAIWVSEIMLQQTRVETVLPYFERFLSRYPTVESLAQAELDEVLGIWSGLGYYRRARLLHQAARQVASLGGRLPRQASELRELPGIGAYTAAAIGSMAFGLVEPAIDGNVERVISRYSAVASDPKRGEGRQRILENATDLLDERRPGDSNQALMELGATVCRPQNPRCSECPLRRGCRGRISGEPEAFPVARPRPSTTRVRRQVAIVENRGRVLLFRRPENSEILAGMWELPWIEHAGDAQREDRFRERYGGEWQLGETVGRVRHSITRRRFEVELLAARLGTGEFVAGGGEAGWFSPADLNDLPVSSLVRKSLAAAAAGSAALAGGE